MTHVTTSSPQVSRLQHDSSFDFECQDRKYLNISFDISFSSMPCAALGLNLLDPKGVNVMHVDHEIYKTRLAKGQPMGRKIRDSLQNTATTPGQLHAAGLPEKGGPQNHSTRSLRCASCFQGHVDSDDCCNSCKELEATFRDTRPYVFAQCVDQLYQEELPRAAEGCRLEVRLEVRKVPGSIHIGVPRHVNLKHVVEEAKDVTIHADFTHAVRDLSFGPDFPGLIPVLNGRQKSNHQASSTEHYQYDFHVIPTSYQEDGGEPIPSHQYSVTEYVKAVDATEPTYEAAASGLWMNYDFTPFEVRVTNSRKSLFHFFTECCAILGGIFVSWQCARPL